MLRFSLILTLLALLLAGCSSGPERAPVLGIAYAGPAALPLHADVDLKSAVIATAHHGDKLQIVGRRRSTWYKVRTAAGLEGWVGDRELLDEGQMQRLRQLSENTAGLPSQGLASAFSQLNVHTEPNRQSASFVQVAEKEQFEVLGHRIANRVPLPKRELIPGAPKVAKKVPVRKKKGKQKEDPSVLELTPPPPPGPPPAQSLTTAATAPPPVDDWTLIRTKAGQTGWVLTNAVYYEIPDTVAQYAEGHHITSYFSLGKTTDHGEDHDIWLWTTLEKLGEDHDFDSYRVFAWSPKRHHYETSYIQRRERGFLPVIAKPGEFSVCIENKEGRLVRKRYLLLNTSVRPAGETACELAPVEQAPTPAQHLTDAPSAPEPPRNFREKITVQAKTWWQKLRGKTAKQP